MDELGSMDNPFTHALSETKLELRRKFVKCCKCTNVYGVWGSGSDAYTREKAGESGIGKPLYCYGCLLTEER